MNAPLRFFILALLLSSPALVSACSSAGGGTTTSDSRDPGVGRRDTRQIAPGVRSDVNRTGTGGG